VAAQDQAEDQHQTVERRSGISAAEHRLQRNRGRDPHHAGRDDGEEAKDGK
jgi:hypothetical protein